VTWVILVLAALHLATPFEGEQAQEQETSIAPYLPVVSGSSLSYRVSSANEVEEEDVARERVGEWMESTLGGETSAVRFDPEDGYLLRWRETREGRFEYERPAVLLPAVMEAGQVYESQRRFVWSVSGERKDVGAHYFEAELVGVEDVVTPAGTFADCLRVRRHETRMDYGQTTYVYDGIDWYAEGVGLVKRDGSHVWKDARGEATESRTTMLELVSHDSESGP
jgi:hypothetical protein